MRGASAQEDALTHVFYLQSKKLVEQQKNKTLELRSRKFKGVSDRGVIWLERDAETLRHTLIDAARPSVELKRQATRERIAVLEQEHPDAGKEELVAMVAQETGVEPRTVHRRLKATS